METYSRIPTRLTWVTPPSPLGAELASAHTTPYCSPGAASGGTAMVTVAVTVPSAGTSTVPGSTDVQLDRSLAVLPSAPMNSPSPMLAAAAYRVMSAGASVVLDTSIRRSITSPGGRWSTM